MKNILFGLFILMFAISCKHGAAKLDINDVEAHRAYQDTLLSQTNSNLESFLKLQSLIEEYKSLESYQDNENSNLDYYIARLNDKIFTNTFYYFIFDSVSKNISDSLTYIKFKDAARVYSKKSLDIDNNNIRAFYIYSHSLYWESATFHNSKNRAPFIGIKSKIDFLNSINYITENAMRFYKIDTSQSKRLSQEVIEHAFYFINMYILNNFNYDNVVYENNLPAIIQLEKYMSVLNKSDTFYILNKNFYQSNISVVSNIIINAKSKLEEINRKENEAAEIARNTIIINHDGTKDWDSESTVRKLGKEVWSACLNYPNAIKIIVNVTDNCKDSYGKKTLYTSTFYITKSDMTEYRKYQDADSFNANCFDWGYKLLNEYKPCGRSQFPN